MISIEKIKKEIDVEIEKINLNCDGVKRHETDKEFIPKLLEIKELLKLLRFESLMAEKYK